MTDLKKPLRTLSLDDDQRFALMKFRRCVSDVLQPQHDDAFLLRWLRARQWNSSAAEKMLRASLKWRERWLVDTELMTWQPPEVVRLYNPSGTCGYDRDGAPIIIMPFAGLDIVGMLHSVTQKDLLRAVIQIVEHNAKLARESGANQVVVVFDMEGFLIRNYAWRPAAEMVVALLKTYEANYPEYLKVCYIVNAPRVFAIAFNVVKRFLNEYTIGKIQIFKNEPTKWKKILLENISPDNLPQYFGGALTDPDGNPRYTTKVNQGGKIPKSFYKKNLQSSDDHARKEYKTATIKQGSKLVLEFPVEKEGCCLRWDFRTDEHDIRFGIDARDKYGKVTPVYDYERVTSQFNEEIGVIDCQPQKTYIVTFDNSYSVMRSKKLHYNIVVTQSLHELQLNADLIDEEVTTSIVKSQ